MTATAPTVAARHLPVAAGHVAHDDEWPHTKRALPWLLAGFLVMLWLVPFQDVRLPINLPIDAKLDRFILGGIALLWIAAFLAGGRAAPRPRGGAIGLAVLSFVVLAFASVLLNLQVLLFADDFTLAVKKLALLVAYATFFYIAATSIRPAEVPAFCALTVGLATVTALGVIWEYRIGANLFYDITAAVLPPGFALLPETGDPEFARPAITGPTQHALALTTILALALPFAVVALLRGEGRGRKVMYGVATALILAGAMATLRKTAAVMPAATLLVLLAYRRREMLRLAPLGIVLILAIQGLSPGALASIRGQLEPDRFSSSVSTQGRTADYDAVKPDIKTHLATGRGYGTYDSHKYRLLDNQYLVLLIEVGILGIAAYVAIALAVMIVAHPVIRSGDASRAPPALAAAAGAAAFVACNALFDTLAFPQVPYLFLFVAALAAVSAIGAGGSEREGRRSVVRLIGPSASRGGRSPLIR